MNIRHLKFDDNCPWRHNDAYELGHQAHRDYETHSDTNIICPKCYQKPKECTENGKYVIKCECEYIHVSEIYSKRFPDKSQDAIALRKQANHDFDKAGETVVICPKCNTHPTESICGMMYTMKCKCGYIYDSEVHGNRINSRPQEAVDLTNKARRELYETGSTTVICPKCGEHPTEYENEYRYTLRCKCGYIGGGEIKL